MDSLITIVGQGLAGTLLGWELERNGVSFTIVDPGWTQSGASGCASSVAAGIVNPITGQRIVKSWRIDDLLPLARDSYCRLERAWGTTIWRDMRVRRLWSDASERAVFLAKQARGELSPFAGEADAEGFWIEGAGQLDVPKLLQVARARWRADGRLIERKAETMKVEATPGLLTIFCTGAALRTETSLGRVPWSIAKGELLRLSLGGLAPDVILNRGTWILPVGEGTAKAGATYTPGVADLEPTSAARSTLERTVSEMTTMPFQVTGQDVGLRLTAPDKHPIAGRIPGSEGMGVLGALGSKGVLLAPWLARQWWNHLSEGVPFDPAIDVARYVKKSV